jgi:hypothetical protein
MSLASFNRARRFAVKKAAKPADSKPPSKMNKDELAELIKANTGKAVNPAEYTKKQLLEMAQ